MGPSREGSSFCECAGEGGGWRAYLWVTPLVPHVVEPQSQLVGLKQAALSYVNGRKGARIYRSSHADGGEGGIDL